MNVVDIVISTFIKYVLTSLVKFRKMNKLYIEKKQ